MNNENIDNFKVCFQGEYNYLYSPFNDMKSRNKFEKKSASELILFNFKKRLNTQTISNENKSFINYTNAFNNNLNYSNMGKNKIEIFQQVKNKNRSVENNKKIKKSSSQHFSLNKLNKNNSLRKKINRRKNYNLEDKYYNMRKPNFYKFNDNIKVEPYDIVKNKVKNKKRN